MPFSKPLCCKCKTPMQYDLGYHYPIYFCNQSDHSSSLRVDLSYYYLKIDNTVIKFHNNLYQISFDYYSLNEKSFIISPFQYEDSFFILNKFKSLIAFS